VGGGGQEGTEEHGDRVGFGDCSGADLFDAVVDDVCGQCVQVVAVQPGPVLLG